MRGANNNYPGICHLFFGKQNNKNSITKFSCCPHLPLSSSASSADVLNLSSKFTTFIYEQSHQCISQPNQTNYLPLIPVNGDDGNYYGTKSVLLLARTHEEGRRRAKLPHTTKRFWEFNDFFFDSLPVVVSQNG